MVRTAAVPTGACTSATLPSRDARRISHRFATHSTGLSGEKSYYTFSKYDICEEAASVFTEQRPKFVFLMPTARTHCCFHTLWLLQCCIANPSCIQGVVFSFLRNHSPSHPTLSRPLRWCLPTGGSSDTLSISEGGASSDGALPAAQPDQAVPQQSR